MDIVNTQDTTPQTTTPQPEPLILNKFKNVDELAAAYTALSAKIGTAGDPPPAAPVSAEPPANESAGSVEEPQKAVGAVLQEALAAYDSTGSIPKEIMDKLGTHGITDQMVQSYLKGVDADTKDVYQLCYDTAGGKDNWDKMSAWAATGIPAEELNSVNAIIAAGNPADIKVALAGVVAKYNAATVKHGVIVAGAPTTTGDSYESREQMLSDMRNPLYSKDPAFRKKVEEKVFRSKGI